MEQVYELELDGQRHTLSTHEAQELVKANDVAVVRSVLVLRPQSNEKLDTCRRYIATRSGV